MEALCCVGWGFTLSVMVVMLMFMFMFMFMTVFVRSATSEANEESKEHCYNERGCMLHVVKTFVVLGVRVGVV